MNVVSFLCVPLGSSAVQLHESLGSRCAYAYSEAGFSSQNGDRVWDVIPKSSALLYAFYGQNDSLQRKRFLFTVGSVCRVKRFTAGTRNSLKDVRKSQMMKRWCGIGWDNSQKLLCCGFRRTGKATGQVYRCWWRICREINVFFSGSNITRFTFYIHLWPIYWLSLVETTWKHKRRALCVKKNGCVMNKANLAWKNCS
jgi:hypothetical protein